jgi:uncharacterized protein YdeI (YjbR/CyaY-like superfamily)
VAERGPVEAFESRAAWRTWLEAEHARSDGVWLKLAKRGSGHASVTHDEALDVALCFGWIDGQRVGFDDAWFLQRFTPRRRASRWSQRNRDKVLALIEAGEMTPAGHAEIERAKADGRWDAAYPGRAGMTVPDDLQAALDADPAAAAAFAALDRTNRYSILYRVGDAKRPETRARRIATFVAMLAAGEKPHP